MREIEKMEHGSPALCLRKKIFYMYAYGKLSNALEILRQEGLLLCFTFEDDGQKRQTEVKRERVLPSVSWKELKLVSHSRPVCRIARSIELTPFSPNKLMTTALMFTQRAR